MIVDIGLKEKVLAKRVGTLFRKNRIGLPGIIIFVLVFLFAYRSYEPQWQLLVWVLLVLTLAVMQWLFMQKFFQQDIVVDGNLWAVKLAMFSFVIALVLGSSVWLFYEPNDMVQTFLIAVLIIGSMFGSVIFAASYFPIHMAWSVPLALPFSILLLLGNTEQVILGGLLIFVGIPVALILGWMMSKEYNTSLQLRFEKDALLKSLQERKEAADKANQDKTHFLAAASHDLRQPHQALGLFVEALDHLETDPKKKIILTKTKQAFKTMSTLLDQLLDISKLDSASIQSNKQHVELHPLLHQVVMEHMGEAEKKGIELRLRVTDTVVYTDVSMFMRIVSNLVTNAIRYTQKGGVLVAVRKRDEQLWLDVLDTGCGIPKNKQGDIFKEFIQLENPERDREKGLGLGLAIVQRLIHILESDIRLTSKVNQGSCFSVLLAQGNRHEVVPERLSNQPVSLEGLQLIVIDDDKIALESMQTLLSTWGCVVYTFASQKECLMYVAQHKLVLDALVVDYRLQQHQTGDAAISEIREFYKQDIPALIMTGDTAPGRIIEAKRMGVPLLHKPVKPSELRAFLARVKQSKL